MKKFKEFTNEERTYDFSHPDAPDTWNVIVPDDKPQKYDKVTCLDNTKFEDKLTVGKVYQILGFSSMGDMYFLSDDTNHYGNYPIKYFDDKVVEAKSSAPSYAPRRKTTENTEILERIEDHNERRGRHEDNYEGYLITTNKRTIKLLIIAEQDCCEDWGYFLSEDEFQDFYGSELISVEVVDKMMNSTRVHLDAIDDQHDEDRGTYAMFVNLNTSEGLLQLTVYNNHNGSYGHKVLFLVDDKIEKEMTL